jgi:HAD superfamily hydrolase (TIGR01458 family)
VRAALLDLDGVVYVGDEPVPGAAGAIDWLARAGIPYLFLTNTTSRPRRALVEKLAGMGLTAGPDQLLTPAVAAVSWLRSHDITRPAVFAPAATAAELAGLGVLPAGAESGAGAVVVGDLGEGWTFPTLNRAFRLLMSDPDVPLVALGTTRYWRAEDGLRLDAGAFVRALEYAAGRTAVVVGKPDPAFYGAAVAALGVEADETVMVGGDAIPDAVLDSVAELPHWWTGG